MNLILFCLLVVLIGIVDSGKFHRKERSRLR